MNKVIDVYSKAAKVKDFHLMSGNNDRHKTMFVSKAIIKVIEPKPDEIVLDVGCGDGTLVKMINCVGVTTTDLETNRLRQEYPNLKFVTGLSESLPFDDLSIDKIVCNSVLLLLDVEGVKKSLVEFHRVLKKGGLVYMGEIPEELEFEIPKSMLKRAISRLRKDGVFRTAKMVLEASKEKVVEGKFVRLETHYFSKPEDFVSVVKQCGFEYKFHFKHNTLDNDGKITNTGRWNYVFRSA